MISACGRPSQDGHEFQVRPKLQKKWDTEEESKRNKRRKERERLFFFTKRWNTASE